MEFDCIYHFSNILKNCNNQQAVFQFKTIQKN